MIKELRKEFYFGEDSPLVCDEHDNYTIKALTIKQVADLLGDSMTQVTEMYYVKKDTSMENMMFE